MDEGRVFQLSNGTVLRGSMVVLHEVDFHLDAGEFVVVLGGNGSGKTTLVKALLGLLSVAAGSVHIFGVPLGDFRAWSRVGYVPQRFTAAAGVPATVEEVVASGRVALAPAWRPYGPQDRAAVVRAIDAVGLGGEERISVARLSGGQQQRVLIARALAGEPDVLVLDEPVSGVDVESQQSFARTLATLKEAGHSVLLVAHGLGAMEPLIDRAVVLEGGHVVYEGPPLPDELHSGHHHHPADYHGPEAGKERP